MRIAYLITAYDQPTHLKRLVSALDHSGTDFYIHIDARADITQFNEGLANRPNVHFAANRVRVEWMGFSQVESILQLLALAAGKGFDYCVLLSGSDYPIKDNAHLQSFYKEANEEFITFWRLSDRPSWLHKIEYFYPIDQIPIRGWSKGTESRYWRRLFWGRFHQYRHWMPRRKYPFSLTPYGGSDWWSLSEGCVGSILRFVAENPAFCRFYRYTHCPSEMFFQTIVLNSEWGRRVRNYAAYQAWSATTDAKTKTSEFAMLDEDAFNLRYVDWSGTLTGERETPAILDDRDWDGLRASANLFARKFDRRQSASVLDRIDREILGRSPVTV
jgi:hypothetical protein